MPMNSFVVSGDVANIFIYIAFNMRFCHEYLMPQTERSSPRFASICLWLTKIFYAFIRTFFVYKFALVGYSINLPLAMIIAWCNMKSKISSPSATP